MHLASVSFDPQLIKGEAFQDCKGLTASIKNNHACHSGVREKEIVYDIPYIWN